VGGEYRLRITYQGPDGRGVVTATAAGFPEYVGTGWTRQQAAASLIDSLRPELPGAVADALVNVATGTTAQSGAGRYWRNLVRGWPGIAALMSIYGREDISSGDGSGRGLLLIGAGSLVLWGLVILLNLGGAADALIFSRGRRVRFVNGTRQGDWQVRTTALAGMAVGAVIIFAVRSHHYG
jgi:hypothetical protein